MFGFFDVLHQLGGFLLFFPFIFLDFMVYESVVFIDVPSDCVQHKLLIYFFRRTIVEPAEVFVLLDISKVAFGLNESDLSVQDSFFTLDIPIG